MKAIRISANGDASVLKLEEVPQPKPAAGEALIRIKAAGLNFIDIYQRNGRYSVPLPYIPGLEASGVVEVVGEGVSEVKPSDRVAYTGHLGSFAEYNVVPAARLIPLPKELTFEQGAAFPLQGMTAHYLIYEYYPIKKGETVLVHAAAGGVGLLLVEWAKHLGAQVIGTVSTEEKAKLARDAGADNVILYSEQDFVAEVKRLTQGRGADYIIDGVGKSTFTKDLEAVRDRGHITIFGAASGVADPLAPNSLQARSVTVHGGSLFSYLNTREELLFRANAVLGGVREGWLKLRVNQVFPLEQASQAQRLLETRKTTGKVILKMS